MFSVILFVWELLQMNSVEFASMLVSMMDGLEVWARSKGVISRDEHLSVSVVKLSNGIGSDQLDPILRMSSEEFFSEARFKQAGVDFKHKTRIVKAIRLVFGDSSPATMKDVVSRTNGEWHRTKKLGGKSVRYLERLLATAGIKFYTPR